MSRTSLGSMSLGLVASLLSACSLAPTYKPPATEEVSRYKEAGDWAPAQPADARQRGSWWEVFADPKLSDLEARLERAQEERAFVVRRDDQRNAHSRFLRAAVPRRRVIGDRSPRVGVHITKCRRNSDPPEPDRRCLGAGGASLRDDIHIHAAAVGSARAVV